MYEVPEIFVSLILGYTLLEKIKYTIWGKVWLKNKLN
jgi:hypothetical protein